MDLFSFPPLAAALDAVHTTLMWLADLLSPFTGSASAAAAVILLTLIVRAVLIPAGIAQAKAEQTRSRLAPRLRALQERYRKSPERLQCEMMQLYADEKTSPFAGIVPVLVQAPLVGLLYSLFLHTTIAGHPNAMLTEQFFGVPLGASVAGSFTAGAFDLATGIVFGSIVALLLVVAELTRRAFRPPVSDLAAAGMPALRWLGALPFVTAIVALFVPLAAALYLVVTVVWTLVQRLILRRHFPPVATES